MKQQVTAKKVFIRTLGCQMNDRDSEIIKGLLLDNGFEVLDEENGELDGVLLVTCSVRQHAEDKVWSEIGRFSKLKPKPVIGLVGCMAENYKEDAFKRMPGIDLVVGTNNIGEIPRLLKDIFKERGGTKDERRGMEDARRLPCRQAGAEHSARRILAVGKAKRDEFVYRSQFREDKYHAYVVISEGCNNFCSYCVVPYVRGRLRHRAPKDILKEIESNVDKGIVSITLLGQNVNAYEWMTEKMGTVPQKRGQSPFSLQGGVDFIKLLGLVNKVRGLKEFSFITSHPKDTSPGLFQAMAELDKLKKYLHLPVQAGSDRILRLMHRGYTGIFYLELAHNYRKIVKCGALTTDIITGFSTETEEDFKATLDLVKEIRFNSAYIFKYSPRPHTEAAKLKDNVPKEEKERRHRILLEAQKQISQELKGYKR